MKKVETRVFVSLFFLSLFYTKLIFVFNDFTMNMQALQQDTLLKGGAYRIEKIINESDYEFTYLSDKYGSEKEVVITEFFMKDLCRREGNRVVFDSDISNDVVTMRDKFKKEAEEKKLEVFEENDTVYYVKEKEEDTGVGNVDNSNKEDNSKRDNKKPSLLNKLKWPLIITAGLGAGAVFYISSSEPPVKQETVTVTSEQKAEEATTVEQTKKVEEKASKVEQESAAFAPIAEKMKKVKKDAESIPGVSQHKVLTELSNLKDEFEKTKSNMSAEEQERFHKDFQEIVEIVKKKS